VSGDRLGAFAAIRRLSGAQRRVTAGAGSASATGAGYFWPAWVLFGWGVGSLLNGWDVYFRRPVTERDIEQEMKRLQR
jgi:hypothetical protein